MIIPLLKACQGPDRGLDGKIAVALGWRSYHGLKPSEISEWPDLAGHWHAPEEGECPGVGGCCPDGSLEPPHYTDSLDAQKPLIHPDWQVSSGNCNEANAPWACVTTPDNVDHTGDGAATEELARLIALLKARGIE